MKGNLGHWLVIATCGAAAGLLVMSADCGGTQPPTSGNHNMSKGYKSITQSCSRTSDCVWPYVCAYTIADGCPTGTNACSAPATCVYPGLDAGACQQTTFCACPSLVGPGETQYPSGPYVACSDGRYSPTPVDTTMACLKNYDGGPIPSVEVWDPNATRADDCP